MSVQVKEGLSLPFRISFRAVRNFQLQTNKGFEDFDSLNFEDLSILFFEGFKSGWVSENGINKDFPYDRDVVDGWLDEDLTLLTKLTKLMMENIKALNLTDEKGVSEGEAPAVEKA